jgi:hypothetical protein
MEWAEETEGSAWLNLEETLIAYELEPNPMRRALAALQGIPTLTDPVKLPNWLKARDNESAELPDQSRQLILDEYFAMRYRATTPKL